MDHLQLGTIVFDWSIGQMQSTMSPRFLLERQTLLRSPILVDRYPLGMGYDEIISNL